MVKIVGHWTGKITNAEVLNRLGERISMPQRITQKQRKWIDMKASC